MRTPEDRFAGLPDFSYPPRYADVDGLRLGYVEAGPPDGEPVLLLHGEPSWSFLYRHVIPALAAAGLRAIAPDLIGFGRSDKPAEIGDHSYARHVEWIRAFAFDRLGLRGLTVVGQDWGGLIGLRLVAEHPDRFARVVAANTGLPTGDQAMPEVWLRFREVVRTMPRVDVSRLVQAGCQTALSPQVLAAYDAPFPDESYKAGVRAMPGLVPTSPDDPASEANRAAWRELSGWDKPFLVAFSDHDPITGAMAPILKRAIPGAAGLEHPVLEGAGHFLQEDAGERLGAVIAGFVRSRPPPAERAHHRLGGAHQQSHDAQYLVCGVSASLAGVMMPPHCSHRPNCPFASRPSAASISASARRSVTARCRIRLACRLAACRVSRSLLTSLAASSASW